MAEEKPKPSPPKNFQEEVADAIVNGDLAAFKKCCVGKNDINRRLLTHKELKPKPKYNPDERYINIKGPTMLMYAILCEQDEIVEYILESKNPNVSVKVEGYNCLHLAAMIKDPKCLKLLLQVEWIQENIDVPIDLPGTNPKEGENTTALHVAVSNRRYANVILLIDDLPPIRWHTKKDKKKEKPKEGESPNEQNAEGATENQEKHEEEEEAQAERSSASINQKSSSGSTPLYIAVFLRDFKMVRILLSMEPDTSIKSAKNKTALELAIDMQNANNEKKQRMQAQQNNQKKKNAKPERDEIDLIVDALNNAETESSPESLEIIKKQIAPELIEEKDKTSSSSSEDEDEDQEPEKENEGEKTENESNEEQKSSPAPAKKKSKSSKASSGDEGMLQQILNQLQILTSKVNDLERERGLPSTNNGSPGVNISQLNTCDNCGASGARQCPQCHKFYCDRCYRKPNIHQCIA